MQLLQHEYFSIFFAKNVLAIHLQMETFPGSSHKNGPEAEDQEKNGPWLLSCLLWPWQSGNSTTVW